MIEQELIDQAKDRGLSSYRRFRAIEKLLPSLDDEPGVLELVDNLLRTEDPAFRKKLIRVMARTEHSGFDFMYLRAVDEGDDYIRREALKALESSGSLQVASALERMLSDFSYSVRNAAERTIATIREGQPSDSESEQMPIAGLGLSSDMDDAEDDEPMLLKANRGKLREAQEETPKPPPMVEKVTEPEPQPVNSPPPVPPKPPPREPPAVPVPSKREGSVKPVAALVGIGCAMALLATIGLAGGIYFLVSKPSPPTIAEAPLEQPPAVPTPRQDVEPAIAKAKNPVKLRPPALRTPHKRLPPSELVDFGSEPVAIRLICDPDKEELMKHAASAYREFREKYKITIDVCPMNPSLLLPEVKAGSETPNVWVTTMLSRRLAHEQRLQSFVTVKRQFSQSPIVYFFWKDRYRLLENQGWKRLRIGVPHPTTDNGLHALALLCFSEGPNSQLSSYQQITPQAGTRFGRRVRLLIGIRPTTEIMMRDFAVRGPSVYDAVVTTESRAIDYIQTVHSQWGDFYMVYTDGLVSVQEVHVVQAKWVSTQQCKVAEDFAQFLMTESMQKELYKFGFRPLNGNVRGSRFLEKYAHLGLRGFIPPARRPLSQRTTRILQEMSGLVY